MITTTWDKGKRHWILVCRSKKRWKKLKPRIVRRFRHTALGKVLETLIQLGLTLWTDFVP